MYKYTDVEGFIVLKPGNATSNLATVSSFERVLSWSTSLPYITHNLWLIQQKFRYSKWL